MTTWLDCSSNYAVVPSPQQVADLRALGFVGAVVGSSYNNPKAQQQLAAFVAGGMRVEEYQFPAAPQPTSNGRWLDCETPEATLERVRHRLSEAPWRGVYSRKGWADENLPNWNCKAEFPHTELWDARYVHGDGPCRIQQAIGGGDVAAAIALERSWITKFRPYWGFESARITQWHNSITICGVNMDINEYDEVEDEEMKSFLAWAYQSQRVYFCGPGGPKYIADQVVADELAKEFGPIETALSDAAIRAMGG